jgi:group I intron endonuclease
MAVIYRITNMANGKYYIGSAESFARREWQHKYDLRRGVHKNPLLQAAWNKYGADMFVFEVLEEIPDGANQLQIEDMWLVQHVGKPECYNINSSAESPRSGVVLSAESKQKISKSRKGKHAGDKHYRYGKTVAPEVREKIGAKQRGKPKAPGRKVSEEGRAKIRANIEAGRSHKHWIGRKHTEEAKAKMVRAICAQMPNGAELHFKSITHMRMLTGLSAMTIHRAIKLGQPLKKGKCVGWRFWYPVNNPLDTP